jgi:uncharacterized repeat protein (TIGR01451 family)
MNRSLRTFIRSIHHRYLLTFLLIMTMPMAMGFQSAQADYWPPDDHPTALDNSTIDVSVNAISPDDSDPATFTITLVNSSTKDVTADVVDTIPHHLVYVADSAKKNTSTGSISFDQDQLTWSGLTVTPDTEVILTFKVTAGSVDKVTNVMNIAEITPDGSTADAFDLGVTIFVKPGTGTTPTPTPPPPDHGQIPVVTHLEIGPQGSSLKDVDVLTSREVTLHIKALDSDKAVTDSAIQKMDIREWQIKEDTAPAWELVKDSGWIDYAASHDWTLGSHNGVHFVVVKVKNGDETESVVTQYAADFANLVEPGAKVPDDFAGIFGKTGFGIVPYLVYYPRGVDVVVTLKPETDDDHVMLIAWFPGYFDKPGKMWDITTHEVKFTTPASGPYVFMVIGEAGATYDLTFNKLGGRDNPDGLAPAALSTQAIAPQGLPGLLSEPVFSAAGLYPPDINPNDVTPNPPADPLITIFLPLLSN